MQFPFFAPLFGLMLTAAPGPPPGLKGLLGLMLVIAITLGVGLVLAPLLGKYPVSALLIIAAGIYLEHVHQRRPPPGSRRHVPGARFCPDPRASGR